MTFEQQKTIETHKVQPTVVNIIDSHFHLDMLSRKFKTNSLPIYSWDWNDRQYQIKHLVANYCFPRNWPGSSVRSTIREDDRIWLTFGIHPRLVFVEKRQVLDSWLETLKHLVMATKVVAVGECGLDTSSNQTERDIRRQLEYFKKQIILASDKNLPLVIHCRGDDRTDELCLNTLAQLVSPTHRIHRHCFNGSVDEVAEFTTRNAMELYGIH